MEGGGGSGGGGGEDEEAPPAYTSTSITPSHTQQDVNKTATGGAGGGAAAGQNEAGEEDDNNDKDEEDEEEEERRVTTGTLASRSSHTKVDGLVVFLKRLGRWLKSVGGLIVLLLAYTFLGAWVMMTIEGPAEFEQKQQVYNARETIAEKLRNNTRALQAGHLNETEWEVRTQALLLDLEVTIHSTGVASTSKTKWTFFGAVLFCVTTYTTIGYGNIAPTTKAGRIATMLYATIGIPLALIVLADLGHRLANGLKFVWSFIRRYYYTGYCRKVRQKPGSYDMHESSLGVDAVDGHHLQHDGTYTQNNGTAAAAAAVAESHAFYKDEVERGSGDFGKKPISKPHLQGVEGAENSSVASTPRKDVLEAVRRSQSVERGSIAASKASSMQDCRASRHSGSPPKREGSVFIDQEELNEDFKLPVGVAVGFIFVYIFAGAGVYKLWEDWSYLESFYFVFITTSTIGFGDVLPEHPNFFLLSCVYTFLGLALVSMAISVIMEWLAKTIDRAKEKVDQAREKAMAKAKAATDKLTEVGSKAKHKVLHTVAREGSASPQLKEKEEHADPENAPQTDAPEEKPSMDTQRKQSSPGPDQSQETKGEAPQTGPQKDCRAGSPGQGVKAGTVVSTPSSDNEASFRTATDFTASSDSVNEQDARK